MNDTNEGFTEHGGKKPLTTKRRGTVTELERLKKRQRELHVMKLSQEWDARRQKRRLDRQKWLQQRRDQNLPIWQRVGHLRVQATDESRAEERTGILLDQAMKAALLSQNSDKESQEEPKTSSPETTEHNTTKQSTENTTTSSGNTEVQAVSSPAREESEAESTTEMMNQNYKSVVVKIERRDSVEFCNSNDHTKQIQHSTPRKLPTLFPNNGQRRIEDREEIYRKNKTWKQHHPPQSACTKEPYVAAYQQLMKMVHSQNQSLEGDPDSPVMEESSHGSVIVQAMQQSGIQPEEAEPLLLLAAAPVRFEDVIREGGTNIQRLETCSAGIIGKETAQEQSDQGSLSRPQSRGTPVETVKIIGEAIKSKPAFPQIRQCFSLLGTGGKSADDVVYSNTKGSTISTAAVSLATPTSTTEPRNPAQGYTLSNVATYYPPPAPAGYIVPIFKPCAGEVVYAFVPNAGDSGDLKTRTHGGGVSSDNYIYPETLPKFSNPNTSHAGHRRVIAPTTTIHHGRHAPIPRAELAKRTAEAALKYSYTQGVGSYVVSESLATEEQRGMGREYSASNTRLPSITSSAETRTTHEQALSSRNFKTMTKGCSSPDLEVNAQSKESTEHSDFMVNGFAQTGVSHTQSIATNGQPTSSASSSPFSSTSVDTILNPTAVYVRPKLVPREILIPQQCGSTNVPVVEYIKTDAICSKELANWTAKNVADFVAATDCADSASIFLEQDIDGKAVLLLSQDIFVNRLNLKLGTAIKLYNHIANLRTALLM